MIVHMWRTGRRMKGDIEGRLKTSSVRPGVSAFVAVFLFTLLMVSREGIETALLLFQLRETVHLIVGALSVWSARPGSRGCGRVMATA